MLHLLDGFVGDEVGGLGHMREKASGSLLALPIEKVLAASLLTDMEPQALLTEVALPTEEEVLTDWVRVHSVGGLEDSLAELVLLLEGKHNGVDTHQLLGKSHCLPLLGWLSGFGSHQLSHDFDQGFILWDVLNVVIE